MQQAAFATGFVTSYARPFTKSNGWPPFPKSLLVAYSDADWELHERLMRLRHQVFAHSDSVSYEVTPLRIGEYHSAIEVLPLFRIPETDLKRGIRMITKLRSSVSAELRRLISVIEPERN